MKTNLWSPIPSESVLSLPYTHPQFRAQIDRSAKERAMFVRDRLSDGFAWVKDDE
jgi:hypothetical protein